MAETRKYNPATSVVGEAIRAALGEGVRPVQPGEPPAKANEKPDAPAAPSVTVKTFTFGVPKKAD
ncbi:MAG: hypothetical protein IPL41_10595 [Micropruina sp.]|nr:hypothetical protein [Micropruina sp.]